MINFSSTILFVTFLVVFVAASDPLIQKGIKNLHFRALKPDWEETLPPEIKEPLLAEQYDFTNGGDPPGALPIVFLHDYGQLIPGKSPKLEFAASCFQKTKVSLASITEEKVVVSLDLSEPAGLLCTDYYFFATSHQLAIKLYFFQGEHEIEFKFENHQEYQDFLARGVHLFSFNGTFLELIDGLFGLLDLFGLTERKHSEQENLQFMKNFMNITLVEREDQSSIDLDEKYVRTGDVFLKQEVNAGGLAQFIAYGTGSHAGHVCVAVRRPPNNELHICEATVEETLGSGIVCNPYKKWFDVVQKDNILWLPLAPEYAKKIDPVKGNEFFDKVAGHPYGVANFAFTWVDRLVGNFPRRPASVTENVFILYAGIIDSLGNEWHDLIQMAFIDGINHRLRHYYSLPPVSSVREFLDVCAQRGMNFFEVWIKPERDEWDYNGKKSMVCASFVARFHKAAGLFGDLEIQGTEFTPKDSYQVKIFDEHPAFPPACKRQGTPWCQLSGRYKIELPGFNSIAPYSHMNENCGSLPFEYARFDEGC